MDESNRPTSPLPEFEIRMAPAATRTRETAALALLLLVEYWLFSGAFSKFFTHDSLFYMVHVPRTWEQFLAFLRAPSTEMSYRPLNLGFIALFRPWLGLDPRPYHWIPIVFHMLNTLLFFLLAKRILAEPAAVFAATAFWGLHAVAGWITYDITYLSDFLLAFLLLASLVLVVEGRRRRSRMMIGASLVLFVFTLLTKESATTFPLAVGVALVLADLRASKLKPTYERIRRSVRKAVPLTSLYLAIAVAFAGLFFYWLKEGLIYAQGTRAAYDINPWSNLLAKTRYFFWALNLPDTLNIPNASRSRALALSLMAFPLLLWGLDILRRRFRLSPAEWGGILWFLGLNIPAFLLSSRLAKWYLYIPLLGLSMAFGVLAGNLRTLLAPRLRSAAAVAVPAILLLPVLYSSAVQTRSYLQASDSSFQSDVLETCLRQFREGHPTLSPHTTLFFLPTFDEHVSEMLSAPPIDHGELFALFYPGSSVEARFAHKGDQLPPGTGEKSDVIVLQYLDGVLYDVTRFFKGKGRMTLFLLATAEGAGAPLLKKDPAGGRALYGRFVNLMVADEGARLPEDYRRRTDLWILRYLNGFFTDVTGYYQGRRGDGAERIARNLAGMAVSIDRNEYYPDYERFSTPTGAAAFFPTPDDEILTQIAGSSVVIPLPAYPQGSRLLFDVSWMFDMGDGGWAEAYLRVQHREVELFRKYMRPEPGRRSLRWEEVSLDLPEFPPEGAELVLKCRNDEGKNTVADWLNWRDLAIKHPGLPAAGK